MFKISLYKVGHFVETKDIISHVNTLSEAVDVAFVECGRIVGRPNMVIQAGFDGEYNLLVGDILCGSFTIVKQ